MIPLRIRTPSRLHFGLLGWGPGSLRQFGGVGLMINAPGIEVSAHPYSEWRAKGFLSARALDTARRIAQHLADGGIAVPPAFIRIVRSPAEHVGLGVGTQLSLAVARLVFELGGAPTPSAQILGEWTGRGIRSGIGLHGFYSGGLIVDGGHRDRDGIPPLLVRHSFPADWSILVLLPRRTQGLHGPEERRAFSELPPIPESLTERLCRLVLLGLLPAVERDIAAFGASLSELQRHVGRWFASAQGGVFARHDWEAIVNGLEAEGLHGAGQSSWGPTLYAFSNHSPEQRSAILERLRKRFGFNGATAFWTDACNSGATLDLRHHGDGVSDETVQRLPEPVVETP